MKAYIPGMDCNEISLFFELVAPELLKDALTDLVDSGEFWNEFLKLVKFGSEF